MVLITWSEVFKQSLIGIWSTFANFLPGLIGAIIVFIVGCALAYFLNIAITQLFLATKIDKLFEKLGARDLMDRAGLKLNVSGFFGGLVKWFTIVVFTLASFDVIGLTDAGSFFKQTVMYYLPTVVSAVIVLIIGAVLACIVRKYVKAGIQALGLKTGGLISTIAFYAVWLFTLFAAFSQLGLASSAVQFVLIGLIVAIALGLGLSFGLGGKNLAEKTLERVSDNLKK
jgi:hypothetical protein